MKPGYQLHVTTWENDGDNYKTQVLSGLSEIDVKFLIRIAENFQNCHKRAHNRYGLTSNEGNNITAIAEMLRDVLALYPGSSFDGDLENGIPSNEILMDDDDDRKWEFQDWATELLYELLGSPGEYYEEDFFMRVCESIKVFYIPGDIEDVTDRFIN